MKANVGDYLVTEAGPRRVVRIEGKAGDPLAGYELENGARISDAEISYDDVLLESEVVEG